MRLKLSDIRDYIAGLLIAENDNVYFGKMDGKKEKSIGIYSRKTEGNPVTALGGYQNTSYECKPVSLLVHWSRGKTESEDKAFQLFEAVKKEKGLAINGVPISFIRLMVPEPQDVGTDEGGVYEYVIWLDFIYQKEAG